MQSTPERDTRNPLSTAGPLVGQVVIPVVQEEIVVDKRVAETGRVKVRTRTSEHQESVELPMRYDDVTVERIAVNRPVDAPVEARQEGDVTIIPVHEEVTVVTRQLVLKEELHVRKITRESTETRQVTLRRQDVDVERLPAAEAQELPPRA